MHLSSRHYRGLLSSIIYFVNDVKRKSIASRSPPRFLITRLLRGRLINCFAVSIFWSNSFLFYFVSISFHTLPFILYRQSSILVMMHSRRPDRATDSDFTLLSCPARAIFECLPPHRIAPRLYGDDAAIHGCHVRLIALSCRNTAPLTAFSPISPMLDKIWPPESAAAGHGEIEADADVFWRIIFLLILPCHARYREIDFAATTLASDYASRRYTAAVHVIAICDGSTLSMRYAFSHYADKSLDDDALPFILMAVRPASFHHHRYVL